MANETSLSTTGKLNNLYRGTVMLSKKTVTYVNLTEYELSEEHKELLSLGVKFHVKLEFDPFTIKVETEMLYESLLNLAGRNISEIHGNL